MKRVFCWLPTPAHTSRYWQDGFRWFRFVWLGADGKHYTTAAEAAKAGAQ